MAALFKEAGIITLVSCISPHQEMRDYARECIGSQSVIEVYVKASLETCQKRDAKRLYAKVRNNEIKEFTGISSNHEEPKNANIVLDTELQDAVTSATIVFDYLIHNFLHHPK